MKPSWKEFLQRWVINTLAVLIASLVVHGIGYDRPLDLVIAALVLGLLNAFVRPLLLLLSLPLLILSLGLFTLVINALLLHFVGLLLHPHFRVDSFGAAFWGALVITIVSVLLGWVTGFSGTRVTLRRTQPRPRQPPGPDDGPVIDV